MKSKKRKEDTGLYMRQWNMELRETISRNMIAYENKVKECRELKKQNNELKKLCNNYEKEHDTVFEEWKAVIKEYNKLQNNRDKAIEIFKQVELQETTGCCEKCPIKEKDKTCIGCLEKAKDILLNHTSNLQSNWNSLREFVTLKEKPKVFGAKNGKALELAMEFVFDMVLDKMNELEGDNNESNRIN